MGNGISENTSSKEASKPVHMHLAALKDILWDAFDNFRKNGDANQAAAIALYAILSIIPLIILSLIAASYFFTSNPDIQNTILNGLREYQPSFSNDLITQLGQIDAKRQVLGWVGIISLIWLASAIFGSIETSLNIIFRSPTGRSYFLSKLIAIAMIPLGWAIGIVGAAITYISKIMAELSFFGYEDFFLLTMMKSALFRYVLPFLLMVLFFTVVYKCIPTKKIRFIEAVAASAIFSALMELAKQFFAWYIASYTRYNVIFGSLEAVVILVIWVFYMSLILLFCAELLSSYQRRDLILLEAAMIASGKKEMKVDERLFRKFGRFYNKGDYIFQEGDENTEMYYILSGRIRLEKQAGGVKKVLAEIGPGNYFGEMAALIDQPRAASARAAEQCSIAAVSGETFRHLLRESEDVSLLMLKEFSRRITRTNASLEESTQALFKLTVIFYFLKEWPLRDEETDILDLTQYTGKSADEILVVLSELSKQGIITVEGDRITDFSEEQAWRLWSEQALI